MYEDIIKTSQDLAKERDDELKKLQEEDKLLTQTDLINKTNVEVAKQLVKFMHEYMTSIEVKNMPSDLAKSKDVQTMISSLEKLINVQSSNTGNLAKSLNDGITGLISSIEDLKEQSADKSEEENYYEQICADLQAVRQAVVDANKAVLTNDKTQDVISSVRNLEKAVKGLKLAPSINVAPTPVDLSGIEKAISEIPSKINIPQTIIPEQDNTDLMTAINQTTDAIKNIIFPVAEFPTTVKVVNPDGSDLGYNNSVTERYDYSSSTTIYVGSADVGTSESSTGWRITKYDLISSSDASGKIATDVSWNNRSSGSYL